MFWILLSIFLITLLIPIPLKFDITFINGILEFKVYNKLIYSNSTNIKKNNNKPTKSKFKKESPKKLSYKLLVDHLHKNIFKPWIKFYCKIDYSLEDSATTAISYGLLYNLNPILYSLLNVFFSIKAFNFVITPHFKDITEVDIKLKSIVFFNLYQAIIIFYYTKKSYT